jgi:hypothetical protein
MRTAAISRVKKNASSRRAMVNRRDDTSVMNKRFRIIEAGHRPK